MFAHPAVAAVSDRRTSIGDRRYNPGAQRAPPQSNAQELMSLRIIPKHQREWGEIRAARQGARCRMSGVRSRWYAVDGGNTAGRRWVDGKSEKTCRQPITARM